MNEREIFDAAIRIQDPVKRRAFVEMSCSGNPLLLNRIESMLIAYDTARPNAPYVLSSNSQSNTNELTVETIEYANWANTTTKALDDDENRIELAFLKPARTPNAIGSLGHYEVLEVLGQGGFGIVFKSFDEKLHRLVAIKVMNPQMAATSPPRKRFLREARSVAGVKHENIVGVHAVEEEPLPYLVMEYIDGITMQQKLDGKGPLEAMEVLHLGRQIASGLAAAHASGLVHRDIKPGNILIEKGAEQKIKITDFGLARSVDDSSMTRTGVISGTPMYMAPEQALGATLDHRTDLFSLGSVLYQMCSGRPPFRASTTVAVLRRVAEDAPRPIQEITPETPEWLISLIDRLLEKNPDDRIQTAKEVADLMGRYQSELQLNGKVTSYVDIAKTKSSANELKGQTGKLASSSFGVPKNRISHLAMAIATIAFASFAGILFIPNWMKSKDVSPIQTTSGDLARESLETNVAPALERSTLGIVATSPKLPVKVQPPIHGATSLVPRPQAIAGLKSWGIVRNYPSGPFTGVGRLSDGSFLTTCIGSPCLFIHNDDWSVQQVLLPEPVGNDRNSTGIYVSQLAPRTGRVAFVNSSYVLCIYDLATKRILSQQPLKESYDFNTLAFSQNEKWLAIVNKRTLSIHSLDMSGPKLSINLTPSHGFHPRSLCWSPDDKEIWMVGQDHSFYAYSAKDLKWIENHPLKSDRLAALDVASDFSEIALTSVDGEVKVLRSADWFALATWKLDKLPETGECKWSPDQKRIAFSDGNRIQVWDRSTQTKIIDTAGQGKTAWKADSSQVTLLFNQAGSLTLDLLSAQNSPVLFGSIKQSYMWDSISPDGTNGVGWTDGVIVHFQFSKGRPDWRLRKKAGNAVIAHGNDRILLTTSWWTPESSELFRMSDRGELLNLPGQHATWSPDDSRIAIVRNRDTVVIHDSQTGKELQSFNVEAGENIKAKWSPDGRFLAVRVTWKKPVLHLWDTKAETLTTHREFPSTPPEDFGTLAPAWRSNSSVLVPFANQVFEVSTAPDALPISKIKGLTSISIAHDVRTDRTLVSHFKAISVFDGNGKQTFRYPTQSFGSLQWLPDGRRFISSAYHYYELPARGFDAEKGEQLGCCFPCLGTHGWLTIGPTGHYQGSDGIESEFRYIALHDDDRYATYTPAEFAKTFQWKNDPNQATFLELVESEY